MHLNSLKIRGFHSIAELTFEPGNFSVLVGPNNAGKSNLLQVIEFLSDVYGPGLDNALAKRGGIGQILHRRRIERSTELEVDILVTLSAVEIRAWTGDADYVDETLPDTTPPIRIRHRFTIRAIGEQSLVSHSVVNEQLTISLVGNDGDHQILDISPDGSNAVLVNQRRARHPVLSDSDFLESAPFNATRVDAWDDPTAELRTTVLRDIYDQPHRSELAAGKLRFFSQVIKAFSSLFSSARIYSPVPLVARQPALQFYNRALGPEGQNLPTLILRLQERHPSLWSEVKRAIFQIAPSLEDIHVGENEFGQFALRFEEFIDDTVVNRSVAEVSDGTIRSLSMLAALFDPGTPLVAFEEPENSLHPWAVRVFIESCRRAVQQSKKQVLLSTHSPVVLDSLVPHEVFVVWQEAEGSRVQQLTDIDPQAEELWSSGEVDLSELIDSGSVRQAIPGAVL